MAVNIGPKIGIEGEAEYRKQLNNIIQSQKTLNAEMKATESTWDKDVSAKQKAAQQTQMLNDQIAKQKQRVDELKYGLAQSAAKFGENDTRTLKWKQALAEANIELSRLENELKQVPNSLQIMGQKMQEAGQKIKSVGQGMTNAGRTMSMYVTAPLVGIATAAVKTTADFEESMSKVQALSGATGEEFTSLETKARDLGKSTKYSAKEAADAMGYMALAGWDTTEIVDGLDGVLDLAAASGMDLATASDLVTDYLSAFGLEAKDSARMADELAYAQAHSNTTTTQLGEAFGNSAARMNTAGQTMETTTALLEAFANQGTKGSEAGTQLSAVVRDLTKKMKNGKVQIGDTSVAIADENGNFRNLIDILADVEKATEGMSETEKAAALQTVFTRNSYNAVAQALTEGIPAIKSYEQALYNSKGAAKTMADTMQDNLKGQLTKLSSQLQELGISFGEILVPQIRKAVEWVQEQVDKFNSLDKSTKEQIVKFGMLAAAIGPVLLIGGKLVTAVGSIIEHAGKAIEWLGTLSKGFGGLAGSMGPVVGAFGLAAGAGVALGLVLKDLGEKYGQVSAVTQFNEHVLETAANAEEARDKLDKSTQAIQDTHENAELVLQEAEAAAKMTDRYAEELYDLASKSERTTEEQRRLEAIVSILNGIYPGFTEAVMDANGELKIGTAELKKYIAQLKEQARAQAIQGLIEEYTAKIVEATKEQIEAENALAEAEEAANEASKAREEVIEQQVSAADQLANAEAELQRIIDEGKFGTEEYYAAQRKVNEALAKVKSGTVEYGDEVVNATETLGTFSNAETTAANEADALNQSIEDNQQAVKEAEDKVDSLNEEYATLQEAAGLVGESEEELAEQTGELSGTFDAAGEDAEDYAEDVKSAAEEIEEANQKIRDSYESAFESAKDSIMGQSSLWEKAEKKEGTSVEAMIEALASHEQALREWDQHSSGLLNSQLYQTDETFRAMVDAVIAGGEDLAPELAEIYRLWSTNDEQLYELIRHYGNVDQLADISAKNIAAAKTAAEYGLEDYKRALAEGIEQAHKEPAKVFANPSTLINGMLKGAKEFGKKTYSAYRSGGQQAGAGVGTGESESTGEVAAGAEDLYTTAEAGAEAVAGLEDEAVKAGQAVGEGIATGARAARGGINSAFTSLRAEVSTDITLIQNLKTTAKTAGQNLVSNLNDGIASTTRQVTTAMNGVKASVEAGINNISAKKDSMLSTGKALAIALSTGLTNQSTSVYNAGKSLGDNLANGVGSASGNATNNARKVANAARDTLKAADNNDPWTWGRHMGDNFANGLGSAYANVVMQARKLAQAVKDTLGHSTPKEGPLKHDDVWGLHLAQNFAQGMVKGLPGVESAALRIANSVAAIPTSTMLDIDAMSGRNMTDALTLDGLFEVISAAVSNQNMTVQIGNREFARILREQGAIA